jgi:nucleotide-binding universal stress UspA family protein
MSGRGHPLAVLENLPHLCPARANRDWKTSVRTYLVVLDETVEAEIALRFATRRAAKTGGTVQILVIVPKQDFVAWGGVQATIESELMENANALVERALASLDQALDHAPGFSVRQGDPVAIIHETLASNDKIAALVLGDSGRLPCPVMIVPGSLSNEALDRLS